MRAAGRPDLRQSPSWISAGLRPRPPRRGVGDGHDAVHGLPDPADGLLRAVPADIEPRDDGRRPGSCAPPFTRGLIPEVPDVMTPREPSLPPRPCGSGRGVDTAGEASWARGVRRRGLHDQIGPSGPTLPFTCRRPATERENTPVGLIWASTDERQILAGLLQVRPTLTQARCTSPASCSRSLPALGRRTRPPCIHLTTMGAPTRFTDSHRSMEAAGGVWRRLDDPDPPVCARHCATPDPLRCDHLRPRGSLRGE